ncbi:DUF2157 domain-containing protein [Natranaeroarchaeum aerophilus]|uniref:DUF2157 domain-containing protein n=1 Tax=Natranaeroarchaeum aerophilus TaxID=2917711 RepID=A0AAE3K6X4_9EURY|nr:DUF2157 domain-containing protein [Natranaeroarchaeum aerophilus]MCL9813269.1 DUF2157 domain-containing protein [Natranaeroarchaeum aerophilus]
MDRDDLEDAVEDWVAADIITREQAEAILDHHEPEDRASRLITALSVMGAVLVGAGFLLFLTANWSDIPRTIRALLLVAIPAAGYGGGVWLQRGQYPRVGLALLVFGAGFVGVSLFALADLFALDVDPAWLLLAWTAVAVPTGHALASRLVTAGGLAVGAATLGTATTAEPAVVIGLYSVVLFALGAWRRETPLGFAYRFVGVAGALGTTIVLAGTGGRFGPAPEMDAVIVAAGVGAVAVTGRAALDSRTSENVALPLWTAIGTLVLAVLPMLAVADLQPTATALLAHLLALVLVLVTVAVSYRFAEPPLVNVAALAFLLVVLSFLGTTVADALSGAVALVVGGLILLAVGLGLERGRRTLLDRMGGSSHRDP